ALLWSEWTPVAVDQRVESEPEEVSSERWIGEVMFRGLTEAGELCSDWCPGGDRIEQPYLCQGVAVRDCCGFCGFVGCAGGRGVEDLRVARRARRGRCVGPQPVEHDVGTPELKAGFRHVAVNCVAH